MASTYVSEEVRYIKELIKAIDQYPSYVAPEDARPGDDIYRLQMDPREYLLEYLHDRINESTLNIVKGLAGMEITENISWSDNRLVEAKKQLFSELELTAIDNFMNEYLSEGEAHLVMNGGKRKSRRTKKSRKSHKTRKPKKTRKSRKTKRKIARKTRRKRK
jgi:hypothetical protein